MTISLAVIGDVGGHPDALAQAIAQIGGDSSAGSLPEGVYAVQVGDLVDTGPDSDGCVAIAERMLLGAKGQWIQLIGNHEARYLGGAKKRDWKQEPEISPESERILGKWWERKTVTMAAGIVDEQMGPTLITHAGLTVGLWKELGSLDLEGTVKALNKLVPWQKSVAFRSGRVETQLTDVAAGPCWAEVNLELYEPWIEFGKNQALPFAQVHGHDAAFNWASNSFWASASQEIQGRCRVDHEARRVVTRLDSGRGRETLAIGVDWQLGATGKMNSSWPVLQLEGEEVIAFGTGGFTSWYNQAR